MSDTELGILIQKLASWSVDLSVVGSAVQKVKADGLDTQDIMHVHRILKQVNAAAILAQSLSDELRHRFDLGEQFALSLKAA